MSSEERNSAPQEDESTTTGAGTGRSLRSENGVNRLAEVQQQIDGTMDVMEDNMRKMAMRGEQMDTLLGKSDVLGATSDEFRGRSRALEQQMWWKKWQTIILVIAVCSAVLLGLWLCNRTVFWIATFLIIAATCASVWFFCIKGQNSVTDAAMLYYGNNRDQGISLGGLGSGRDLNRWNGDNV